MLSQAEYSVLIECLKANNKSVMTQRKLSQLTGLSLGKVNSVVRALNAAGFLFIHHVTEKGIKALKPYKVENAIIMAAGMSSRFAPLSYEKPKGLLAVKGEVLIEREIRQLKAAGINDITIVVGYMKEKFFYLEELFDVKIVINEDYYKYNNTSTLMRVLDRLSNTYICSSDNYFTENVFEPYVYRAYYSAVYAEGETQEYCITTDRSERIKNVTIGGANSWYMLGHVYFDKNFSDKFKAILESEYKFQQTREQLWENLYMRHINELDMYIRKYDQEVVHEFDSLEELREFDETYINNADSSILKNICGVLNCEIQDIKGIHAISKGLTNTSFKFEVCGKKYVYRHPGLGTDKYINRRSEYENMQIASKLGLDDTFVYMDEKVGWKISNFIDNVAELDYHNKSEVIQALSMMRRLHDARLKSNYDFDVWARTEDFIEKLRGTSKTDYPDFETLYEKLSAVNDIVKNDGFNTKCLCHNDCYSPNFLLDETKKMYLIDWEYSGNDDPASDLGTFICCSDYSVDEAKEIIMEYLGREAKSDELAHYFGYVAITSYYWFVWALYQESRGEPVGEWLYIWHKNSKIFAKETLRLVRENN